MDQVSPALQFGGVNKVETSSWESSSPQSSVCPPSSCESIHTSHDFTKQQPEVYSVETMDGNPDRSRDSTTEPLTPLDLEVLHDAVVDRKKMPNNEYETCGMPIGEEEGGNIVVKDPPEIVKNGEGECYDCEQNPSVDSINSFRNYPNQMVVDMPNVLPQLSFAQSSHSATSSTSPSSSSATEHPMSKCIEIYGGGGVPACISFGTHLAPEKQDHNVIISVEGAELWHQFFQAGTEMIITKSGRRMFPGIVVSIGGLDPDIKYSISLEFNPVDNARYKYINTKWVNIGKAEAHCEEMLKYIHPESPSMGKHWMSSKISFKKIRVTNNKNHKKGSVVALNSMHKYQPRVVISKFTSKKSVTPIFTHDLVECTFIGVTAYQNDQVTQLKIDHNPFAKAFRENGSDNETYGYGVINPWPPISPLLSPYASSGSFSPDSQVTPLPMLSPGCISPAGPSPLPQFNTAFASWESPPYSPTAAGSYRTTFPNTGLASSLFPDHRQILSSRLIAQDSPPISPLLYSPTGYTPTQHHMHHLHQIPIQTSTTLQTQQYAATFASSNAAIMQQHQPQLLKPLQMTTVAPQEAWGPKNDYAIVASVTQSYAYDRTSSSSGACVGYQQPAPRGEFSHPVTKIEIDASPVNLTLEVQQ